VPTGIQVAPGTGWILLDRKASPAAVLGVRDAAGHRAAVWSAALARRTGETRRLGAPGRRVRLRRAVPVHANRSVHPGHNRAAVAAISEDLLQAADVVLAPGYWLRPVPTGTGSSGELAVTLGEAALESCTADPKWTYRQSAGMLESAFRPRAHRRPRPA